MHLLLVFCPNVKTLAETINVQPKIVRSFLRGKLSPGQSQKMGIFDQRRKKVMEDFPIQ